MVNMIKLALKHPEVYPLLAVVGVAASLGTYWLYRSAFVYPDVVWNHKTNPHPWQDIRADEQRKLLKSHDYYRGRTAERPIIPELAKKE